MSEVKCRAGTAKIVIKCLFATLDRIRGLFATLNRLLSQACSRHLVDFICFWSNVLSAGALHDSASAPEYRAPEGTQFTCFTATKVQILCTYGHCLTPTRRSPTTTLPPQFACFTGTKVQIFTPEELKESNHYSTPQGIWTRISFFNVTVTKE